MKQQQQQPSNPSPQFQVAPNEVTTEQIQKLLEDNKNLIMAILENQSQGKLAECNQYQGILQKNLMFLAAIADAQSPQSQASTAPAQLPPSSSAQQGNQLQKPHTLMPQQQQQQQQHQQQQQQHQQQQQQQHHQQQQQHGVPVGKLPFQLNTLHSQDPQQQLMHMRSAAQLQGQVGGNNPVHHQSMHPNFGGFMGGGYNSAEANSNDGQGQGK